MQINTNVGWMKLILVLIVAAGIMPGPRAAVDGSLDGSKVIVQGQDVAAVADAGDRSRWTGGQGAGHHPMLWPLS